MKHKKLSALVVILCMVFTMLPANALAADETEIPAAEQPQVEEAGEIHEATITDSDYLEPQARVELSCPTNIEITADAPYMRPEDIEGVSDGHGSVWIGTIDNPEIRCTWDEEICKPGKSYYWLYSICAKEGYTFAPDLKATFNSKPADKIEIDDDGQWAHLYFQYDLPKDVVPEDKVSMDVKFAPAADLNNMYADLEYDFTMNITNISDERLENLYIGMDVSEENGEDLDTIWRWRTVWDRDPLNLNPGESTTVTGKFAPNCSKEDVEPADIILNMYVKREAVDKQDVVFAEKPMKAHLVPGGDYQFQYGFTFENEVEIKTLTAEDAAVLREAYVDEPLFGMKGDYSKVAICKKGTKAFLDWNHSTLMPQYLEAAQFSEFQGIDVYIEYLGLSRGADGRLCLNPVHGTAKNIYGDPKANRWDFDYDFGTTSLSGMDGKQIEVEDAYLMLLCWIDEDIIFKTLPVLILPEGVDTVLHFEGEELVDPNPGDTTGGTWKKDNTGWWYALKSGGYLKDCKVKIGNSTYRFDKKGYMVTGWSKEDGKWYYYDVSGAMTTGWANIGNIWYYFDQTGVMVTGFQKIGEQTYYFDTNGYMAIGWKQIDGKYYYFDASGAMQRSKWIGESYVDENGVWDQSKVKPKWIQNSIGWWYRHEDGSYTRNDFEKIGEQTYYFDTNGYMVTGWKAVDSKWYYFTESGAMARNSWAGNYYLKEDGTMAVDEWVDNGKYYVDSTGKWVPGKTK